MPTPTPTPTPLNNHSAFLPIVMILLGLALIGFSWLTRTSLDVPVDKQIEKLISEISNPKKATPTQLVIVVPNGQQQVVTKDAAPLPTAPAAPAGSAGPIWVGNSGNSNPINPPALSRPAQSQSQEEVFPTAAPAITVTATLVEDSSTSPIAAPIITVTATLIESTLAKPTLVEQPAQNMGGHCTQWTNDECVINPTATTAPTYVPPTALPTTITERVPPTTTPLPPTPTITPTPLPENNSIKSLVTRQGAINHASTQVLATKNGVVEAHATTSENGEFILNGLDKGRYQLAAYSPNGSHLPACKEITIGGNESIVIAQTMLSNGGGFNTDSSMNIGAAALVAIQLGLTIPEHMRPILDVNQDQKVDQTDADMLITNPKLLACQQW